MFDLAKLGRRLGLTVGVAAGLAGVGLVTALRRPLPRTGGRVQLHGLDGRTEVRRDTWGVPHIYAQTNRDLFAALGYVHAQDRLWQMELNRRTGSGRLAEVLGPVALSSDMFVRTIGFSRIARKEVGLLDEHTHEMLQAYSRGVNTFIEQNSSRLPLEFQILGFQPKPWEPADSLVWSKMMALNLSANWQTELLQARLVAMVGPERAAELVPNYPDDALLTVPADSNYSPTIGEEALNLAEEATRFTGKHGGPQGSNAWVVGGKRSASGKPLLADDPHLGLALPGIWYLAHLDGGDYHVTGGTMPGTCGVVIGHNQRIAWGVTNGMNDNQDLYIERFDAEDPLRYQWKGEWRSAELVREEINVKGAAPQVLDVRITHHGPIIDPISGPGESALLYEQHAEGYQEGLALCWTALDPSPTLSGAVLKLNRASNWKEFRSALTAWDVPPQNFVYADIDGHIGYTLAGKLPIRAKGNGLLPVPGWDGEYEWTGFIPADELPHVYDPASNMAVTANNRLAGSEYAYHEHLQGEWLNPYRATRITELIKATERHDARSFAKIHHDIRSLPGLALAKFYRDLPLTDPLVQRARDLLVNWDGELTAESPAGAIYAATRYHLERLALAELGDLQKAKAGLGAFGTIPANTYLLRALPHLLTRIAQAPAPDRADPWLGGDRTWNDLLSKSLQAAVAELRRLGDDPSQWAYGRVHQLTLRHPLGGVAALTPVFNRGPWPTGGDVDTVNQNYAPRDTAAGPSYNGPSYRHIIDLSDWDASRVILPAGQSGHPASRHYSDMAEAWRTGGYAPMLWSRLAVEHHTAAVMVLEP